MRPGETTETRSTIRVGRITATLLGSRAQPPCRVRPLANARWPTLAGHDAVCRRRNSAAQVAETGHGAGEYRGPMPATPA
jgi:hypothetical protein